MKIEVLSMSETLKGLEFHAVNSVIHFQTGQVGNHNFVYLQDTSNLEKSTQTNDTSVPITQI